MSRKDTYHDAVKRALVRDGWRISHDPFPITYEGTTVSTDLGAEKVAESDGQLIAIEIIAVEVKDFDSRSLISEFEKALGQYRLYRALLKRNEPDRVIFLAVREEVYNTFFQLPAIQAVVDDDEVRFIVFDEQRKEVIQWVK